MKDGYQQRIDAIRHRFVKSLPQRLSDLSDHMDDGPDVSLTTEIRRQMHEIDGTGSTLGLIEIGQIAQRVEEAVRPALAENRRLTPIEMSQVQHHLDKMRALVSEAGAQ